ncbi:glycosyltransferase family 4 protein [Microbacterium sp. MPKO10]|uniref:glycosyltransferase family 4 protein n=1 Tax=Microbacterium sp. MPKO10 TaxID=2989818 RepID=UPI002236021E|nr:glycosyltransferase family 4 protein [Microbacterium sp. MPKO10]MCW4458865.1 glycosyltransferase family 4 protein [Microbacterium sp. MPKO10]
MSQRCTLVLSHTAQEGGAELALVRLVRVLRERGNDVRVLLFAHGPLEVALAEADVPTAVCRVDARVATASRDEIGRGVRTVSYLGAALGFIIRLRAVIRESGADLVVANTLKAAVFAAIASPLAGQRWAWHLHDRLARDYLPQRLRAVMRTVALIGPRVIVANSNATRETLPVRARRRTVVAYPGLADEAFIQRAPEYPRVVGIVGRISPTKGQGLFVEAAHAVSRTRSGVRYRVVGSALFGEVDYEDSVRNLVERLELTDLVDFTGWARDVSDQIGHLSVLVHASPVPEPFGQVVIEALAASVPVVATESGGVVEILDPAAGTVVPPPTGWRSTDLGVLVRPNDPAVLAEAIGAVLDDPTAAQQRAQTARALVRERFAITRTADVVEEAWAEARGRTPTKRRRYEAAN